MFVTSYEKAFNYMMDIRKRLSTSQAKPDEVGKYPLEPIESDVLYELNQNADPMDLWIGTMCCRALDSNVDMNERWRCFDKSTNVVAMLADRNDIYDFYYPMLEFIGPYVMKEEAQMRYIDKRIHDKIWGIKSEDDEPVTTPKPVAPVKPVAPMITPKNVEYANYKQSSAFGVIPIRRPSTRLFGASHEEEDEED